MTLIRQRCPNAAADADLYGRDATTPGRERLLASFRRVRAASIEMCRPLAPEAYRVQPMEEASPPWWNLGHTSWFFVRAVLQPFGGQCELEDDALDFVLNSYYASFGPRVARGSRGSLSRPTTEEVCAYRASVDRRVEALLADIDCDRLKELAFALTVGLNHEQQHQELFYCEIKSILALNPPALRTPYLKGTVQNEPPGARGQLRFTDFNGGLLEFGHADSSWCWDNELPQHKYYLSPFALADRLTTNREYLEFMEDGGYQRQLLWLDNGWNAAQQNGWQAPLYWEQLDGRWHVWTLGGLRPLEPEEPVCHVSFYEADAFARWRSETIASEAAVRLPTEREWERAGRLARHQPDEANVLLDLNRLHPTPDAGLGRSRQMFGTVWQWTASYYEPYPGFRPFPGELAEYNGKFMDNQRVLRGGSCATPRDHFRVTYRNFWHAATRFQFTGIRLAHSLEG